MVLGFKVAAPQCGGIPSTVGLGFRVDRVSGTQSKRKSHLDPKTHVKPSSITRWNPKP